MEREGSCPFGETCSYYHNDVEKRGLTEALPNQLPEGAQLPPMPKQIYKNKMRKANAAAGGSLTQR